jgi:hypothetical protein
MEQLTTKGLTDFISMYKQRLNEEQFPNTTMISTTKKFKVDGLIVEVILKNPGYIIGDNRRKESKAKRELGTNEEIVKKANKKIDEIYREFPEYAPQKTLID